MIFSSIPVQRSNPARKIGYMHVVKLIERTVVIIATLAAIFPLYQWYSEADDRRVDRVATLVMAGQACNEALEYSLLENPPHIEGLGEGELSPEFWRVMRRMMLASGLEVACARMIPRIITDEEVSAVIKEQLAESPSVPNEISDKIDWSKLTGRIE